MMNPVDSKQQQLTLTDIVQISGYNQGSEYALPDLMTRIVMELSLPNTKHMIFGNTLFIINQGEGRDGYMRALNADTAQNFLENSVRFANAAYMLGIDNLYTEFQEPSFIQVFRYISRNPMREDMGYELIDYEDGTYGVNFKLGPEREAAA
jgi:hypothetical protein